MTAALAFLGYAYVLWVLFLAAMSMRWAWPRMSITAKALATPVALLAFVLDILFNVAASIPFVDLPREATFSQRMGRYKTGDDWRAIVARHSGVLGLRNTARPVPDRRALPQGVMS